MVFLLSTAVMRAVARLTPFDVAEGQPSGAAKRQESREHGCLSREHGMRACALFAIDARVTSVGSVKAVSGLVLSPTVASHDDAAYHYHAAGTPVWRTLRTIAGEGAADFAGVRAGFRKPAAAD
jgi:hypothetical protein